MMGWDSRQISRQDILYWTIAVIFSGTADPATPSCMTFNSRYINLLTDFGFKRVFGTEPNKALLQNFLNTLLPDYHQIAELTFQNSENVGNTAIDRKAIFDIYCQSEAGDRFIVELQKARQNYFKDRSVYYTSFPIQEQAPQGEWNFKLKPVYTIGILDFVFDNRQDDDTVLHRVELKDQLGQVFYDKLTLFYIELPKFQKPLEALETQFEKWLYLFRHLPDFNDLPPLLQEDVFEQLFTVAEIARFSRDEQDSYQRSLKYYRDLTNVVETAREEGIEEGRAIGREEGIEEGERRSSRRFVQGMLDRGMSLEQVGQTTGLSMEELAILGFGED